eukprot:CAMPEP_0177695680 /NCGR_PEP_ID=MMETSP0484_2-20121128/3584_1 /TAXON_ID=354590 /ORGANISM="Rhodomonas lens, Strain RHODO" /LENGTH=275 /DNA_ID=CAMNT_0019206617 /DNA_START=206 /DNA_END=1033 /DNA_ORIENTATION=-
MGLRRVLRGGAGLPNMPASWLKNERLGIYSPYVQVAMKQTMDHGMHQTAGQLNKLQELMMLCHFIFAPLKDEPRRITPEEIEGVSMLVDDLTPTELGVPEPQSKAFKTIEYTEVFAGEHLTICIFKLPAGAQLPMHDHPQMTVWSKVLWGEMAVHAYDLAPVRGMMGGVRRGRAPSQVSVRRDGEVWGAASGVQVTEPDKGNIHQFTAVTPCCFLDVLAPPYNFQDGRPCTYYQVDPQADGSHLATPVRCPDSYVTRSVPYKGIEAAMEDSEEAK